MVVFFCSKHNKCLKCITPPALTYTSPSAHSNRCASSEITRAGGWSAERVDMSYLCTINVQAATALAGYIPGTFNPYRTEIEPPQELLKAIFPLIEETIKQVMDVSCV